VWFNAGHTEFSDCGDFPSGVRSSVGLGSPETMYPETGRKNQQAETESRLATDTKHYPRR